MTKLELRKYRDYGREIDQLRREKAMWYSRAERSTRAPDRAPSFGGSHDPYPAIMDKISEINILLTIKELEATALRIRIETAIGGLEPKERVLMRAYYCEGRSWREVAQDAGYSIEHTWRLHGEILKKMRDNESFI